MSKKKILHLVPEFKVKQLCFEHYYLPLVRRKVVTQQMTSRNNCDEEYCVIQGVTVRELLHKLRNDQQFHTKNE